MKMPRSSVLASRPPPVQDQVERRWHANTCNVREVVRDEPPGDRSSREERKEYGSHGTDLAGMECKRGCSASIARSPQRAATT